MIVVFQSIASRAVHSISRGLCGILRCQSVPVFDFLGCQAVAAAAPHPLPVGAMPGAAAVTASRYGTGRVWLSSLHPELSGEQTADWLPSAVRWASAAVG